MVPTGRSIEDAVRGDSDVLYPAAHSYVQRYVTPYADRFTEHMAESIESLPEDLKPNAQQAMEKFVRSLRGLPTGIALWLGVGGDSKEASKEVREAGAALLSSVYRIPGWPGETRARDKWRDLLLRLEEPSMKHGITS